MFKAIRWFLVALMPFLGLYLGTMCIPELKPKWEIGFPFSTGEVGLVDDGKTLLLIEQQNDPASSNRKQTFERLIGIDTLSGEEQLRVELPQEVRHANALGSRTVKLSADGGLMLFLDSKEKSILLYDWKRNGIIRRYRCEPAFTNINEAMVNGDTLLALTSDTYTQGKPDSYLMAWNAHSEQPKWSIHIGEMAGDLCLSPDGKMAIMYVRTNNQFQLVFVDTIRGKIIRRQAGIIRDVKWSTDSCQMSLLYVDGNQAFFEQYAYLGQDFTSISKELLTIPPFATTRNRPYFVLHTYPGNSALRSKIRNSLDQDWGAFLDRLWPVEAKVSVLEPETGKVIRSLTLDPSKIFGRIIFLPDFDAALIHDGWNLHHWSLSEKSTWPKWTGLMIGILLASLLAWKNLKLKAHRLPT